MSSIRETGAAAIWASDHDGACEWDKVPEPEQDLYLRNFDAAVAAFTLMAGEQGWRMRPDEATYKMIVAGDTVRAPDGFMGGRYQAMLEAAPEFDWRKE